MCVHVHTGGTVPGKWHMCSPLDGDSLDLCEPFAYGGQLSERNENQGSHLRENIREGYVFWTNIHFKGLVTWPSSSYPQALAAGWSRHKPSPQQMFTTHPLLVSPWLINAEKSDICSCEDWGLRVKGGKEKAERPFISSSTVAGESPPYWND